MNPLRWWPWAPKPVGPTRPLLLSHEQLHSLDLRDDNQERAFIDQLKTMGVPVSDKHSFAPSEEMVLHCDVRGCEAQLSMVADLPRAKHGWGRATIYHDGSLTGDHYDLCFEHFPAVLAVLAGD